MIIMIINTVLHMLQNSRDLFCLVFSAPQHFWAHRRKFNKCLLNERIKWQALLVVNYDPEQPADLLPRCLQLFLPTAKSQEPSCKFQPWFDSRRTPSRLIPSVSPGPALHPIPSTTEPLLVSCPAPVDLHILS